MATATPAGRATVTANFADNFVASVDYGTDGPGTTGYSLVLTGSNVASGLFALGANGAPGASIVLNQAAPGADIIGTVGAVEDSPHQHQQRHGRAVTVQPEPQCLARQHWQRRRYLDADAGERRRSASGADGDRRRRRQGYGRDQPGAGGVFQIEDDGPSSYTPAAQTIVNVPGSVISGDLDTGAR